MTTPEPIAIVGVGLRFPGDNNTLSGFAEFLDAGGSGTTPLPADRWDVPSFTGEGRGKIHTAAGGFVNGIDQFDPLFFNISPKEAHCIDPQQRLVLETAWEALESANIDPTRLRHGIGGAYFGASAFDYALEIAALADADMDGHIAAGLMHSAVSGRLSYFLGLRGPSLTVDTACSASLVALHLAVSGLRGEECDMALCGGVNAIHHPHSTVLLSDMNALAADGRCKTFDESADGYGRAEGCGVIVLKRHSDAERDGDTVLAVVRGSAVRQDGESAGLTVPNGNAQVSVMHAALANARLEPADIQYVEAHGTGTPLGDPIELGAINEVYGASHSKEDPLLVGSLKTNFGHLEAGAGIAGVVKTVLQLKHATVFPHINLDTPSSRIPWDSYPIVVPDKSAPWVAPVRRAMVNSFGFTGTIAAVVLEQAPPTATPAPAAAPCAGNVLTLSAKTATALGAQVRRYHELVSERPDLDVADLCYTSNVGRAHFRHRVAGAVRDRADVLALLGRSIMDTGGRPGKVAFLFTGQGSQYAGMGTDLARTHPVFARELEGCDRLLAPLVGRSVTTLTADELSQTRWTQPALFALEYALAKLWLSWGVRPNSVAGHSIGEVVAATVAGVLTLPDAATLVAARARLMSSVDTPGGMVSVAAPVEDVTPLLDGHPDLAIAAINAPRQCVVSGGLSALATMVESLTEQGVNTKPLAVSHAFHSPLMNEVLDEFREALRDITFHPPELTVVSTRTGQVAKRDELADPEYWVRQIVEPVDFLGAMGTLHRRGKHVFIEIGPAATLTSLGRKCVPATDHTWLHSLRQSDVKGRALLEAAAKGYPAGLGIDWAEFHSGHAHPMVELPAYPFEHKRYWLPVGDRPVPTAEPAKPEPKATPVVARESSAISDLIRAKLAEALDFPSAADIDPDADFTELGLDSLVAVGLRQTLTETLGVDCPASAAFDYPTASRLADFLEGQLRKPHTIAAIAAIQAADRPEHVAINCEGRTVTYAQLHQRSNQTAHAIMAAGLRTGSRVAYLGRESEHYYDIAFGCAKSGTVLVPINWRLTPEEVQHILVDSRAELLFVEPEFERVELSAPRTVVRLDAERFLAWKADQPDTDLEPSAGPGDPFAQVYTSGTTGLPKGVVLSNACFFALRDMMAAGGLDWVDWQPDDVSLISLPGLNIAGLSWSMQGFTAGVTNVVMRMFNGQDAVRLVRTLGITTTFIAPAMLQMMLAEPGADRETFGSLRKVCYGASPISEALLLQCLDTMRAEFVQVYAATETGNAVTLLPPHDHVPGARKLASAGRALPGVTLKIVDEQGHELPAGQTGRICIHTPAAMLGYWMRPAETERTLVDGWLHMGDAGYLDEDGYLYLCDRIDDTIIVAGQNVYPVEVEKALGNHPAVADVAVIGVPHERWGEAIQACVVLRPGHTVRPRELMLSLQGQLAGFKIPTRYEFVDSLPRNPTGKVVRRTLRESYRQRMEAPRVIQNTDPATAGHRAVALSD